MKKYCIYNVFLTFAFGFLIHGLYSWFPSIITSIFPVNESLYEHIKLIFYSPIFSSMILYLIFYKKIHFKNFIFGLFISTLFNIGLFYLIFIPIYRQIGENLTVTLIIYFITIMVSQYLNYLIINSGKNHSLLNIISLILLFICTIPLTYLTYHPMINDFFRDSKTNIYGIKK